jgi:cob(I)alamin adenosyltransferase
VVKLTKIYTKTGDAGQTSLGNLERVDKNSLRIRAIGKVDTANSYIGLAASHCNKPEMQSTHRLLLSIQNDLFDLGADLSVPMDKRLDKALRIVDAQIGLLEDRIDIYNKHLSKLNSFVLPGGSVLAAHLHVARCEVREAEIATWDLVRAENINPLVAKYLNRLSDLLFVLARFSNGGGDILWNPGSYELGGK